MLGDKSSGELSAFQSALLDGGAPVCHTQNEKLSLPRVALCELRKHKVQWESSHGRWGLWHRAIRWHPKGVTVSLQYSQGLNKDVNTSDTPVLSSGDYLKIKAIKIHLGDTGMDENTFPGKVYPYLHFSEALPIHPSPHL